MAFLRYEYSPMATYWYFKILAKMAEHSNIEEEDIDPEVQRFLSPNVNSARNSVGEVHFASQGITVGPSTPNYNAGYHTPEMFARTQGLFVNKTHADHAAKGRRGPRNPRAGFVPAEILSHGALSCQPCRGNNLQNDIFTAFRRANFHDLPDELYDFCKPAFRLATVLIFDRKLMPFWSTIAFGQRNREEVVGSISYNERIPEFVEMSDEMYDRTSALLHKCTRNLTFQFTPAFNDGKHVGAIAWSRLNTWEVRHSSHNGSWKRHRQQNMLSGHLATEEEIWADHYYIHLTLDYISAATRYMQLRNNLEPNSLLRFYFSLAVTLVHEMAHVFENKVSLVHMDNGLRAGLVNFAVPNWHRDIALGHYPEVYLLDFKDNEMGEAWERIVFGGKIMPLNGVSSGVEGMIVYNNFQQAHDLRADGKPIGYMIPMGKQMIDLRKENANNQQGTSKKFNGTCSGQSLTTSLRTSHGPI